MRRLVPLMLAAMLACDADGDEPGAAEAYCELMAGCDPFVVYDVCVTDIESPPWPEECTDAHWAEIECVADSMTCGSQSSESEACGDLVQARIDCVNSH
jgi:hypothetical protein